MIFTKIKIILNFLKAKIFLSKPNRIRFCLTKKITSMIDEHFHRQRFFSITKEVFYKKIFSLIKEVFHKLFFHKDFPMIKEAFHEQRFYHDWGIFPWSGKLSASKNFLIIKFIFHKQRFYIYTILKILGKNILRLY